VGPSGRARQFEYDDRDSLVGFQDGSGATWRYEYDERFHLAKTTMTPADGGPAHTVEWAYDGMGRLRLVRDVTDPAAPHEIELQYDQYTLTGIWQR
jgi:YD repeat-containing protein